MASEVLRSALHSGTSPEVEPAIDGNTEPVAAHRRRSVTLKASNRLPRILMVEDNWDHAYLGLKALTADGRYQVELVASGAEALYKLNSGEYALVLLDYCLSGMNGLNLIRKIKELGQDIPIVMITGLGSETVAVEAMKMGAYDYVIKAGSYLATLPMTIDKALERHELKKVKEQWDHWVLKRNRELGALSELGSTINQSLEPTTVIAAAANKVVEILGADYGKIYLADALQRAAVATESTDADEADEAGAETVDDHRERISSIIRQVAESGEPVVLESVSPEAGDGLFEPHHGLRSSIYLPLRSKREVLGVLVIGSRRRLQYTSQDMVFYTTIANQIAVAIENAQLYETLKTQAKRLGESEACYRLTPKGRSAAEAESTGSKVQSQRSSP